MATPLFQTQRQRLLAAYEKAGQPFIAKTVPYHSTRQIEFEVVDAQVGFTPPIAFAVARAPQELVFFSYGVGDAIGLGDDSVGAGESETNLASGKSTNGAADFVIEGVGFSCRGARIQAEGSQAGYGNPADAAVVGAFTGSTNIFDPAAILVPAQVHSPFNLEQAMFQALLPFMSLEFEWDRSRVEKLGIVDLLPQGGGASYLRANGVPASENRYRIPEGYLWRRDGQPDSEFIARVRLQRSVVVPISLSPEGDGTAPVAPSSIYLEMVMRLFGLSCDLPSAN